MIFKPRITLIDASLARRSQCHECFVEVKKSFIRVICAIRGKYFYPVNLVIK